MTKEGDARSLWPSATSERREDAAANPGVASKRPGVASKRLNEGKRSWPRTRARANEGSNIQAGKSLSTMAGRAALGDRGSGPQALDDGASRSRGDRGGGDAVPQRQPITRPSMRSKAARGLSVPRRRPRTRGRSCKPWRGIKARPTKCVGDKKLSKIITAAGRWRARRLAPEAARRALVEAPRRILEARGGLGRRRRGRGARVVPAPLLLLGLLLQALAVGDLLEERVALVIHVLRPVWSSTTGLGGPDQTSEFSSSIKSKSIRLIFGRIDCSRRVLEAQPKSLRRNCRICAH